MTILYSTGCPQCVVLEEKLNAANINYVKITNPDEIISKGISKVPVLEVDGNRMELVEANKWLKNKGC